MLHLWIIFILLPQGYPLISVTKGQLGEPVTFTCLLPLDDSITRVKWYKQSVGDTLALIATFMPSSVTPILEQSFSPSRFAGNYTVTVMSTLTILKTMQEDEALYHCAAFSWQTDVWTGTFLSLKGNNEGTTNYTVVQRPTVSGPVQPGHSVTLQCSVLFDSPMGSCPDENSILWFGVRSDKSLGNIVYTKGVKPDECGRKADTASSTKSCVYQLSKKMSLSDIGTYYCALATCWEIIFGNGTKLDIKGKRVVT
ncbi:uncharacterized protein LOC133447337 [Cololabis saira]|uniref:uncharacterized protein LOC133447337 n=1 Tax=Cololabis saira TaxID=129043 RepID=UPI002AD2F9DA|nr:uncharacterized protein LOC133447337 [Cololabis saira]